MIMPVLNQVRWDMIKLRRRWMPWVFLGVVVLVSQLRLLSEYEIYNNIDIGRIEVQTAPPDEEGKTPTIGISCLDIRDGAVESKLSMVQSEYRQTASKEIESLRERCTATLAMYDLARNNFLGNAILPNSLAFYGLSVFGSLGYIFVMVLAAMAMGVEYTWGTARQVLAKGCGRGEFLLIKILSLMAVVGIGHMVVMLVTGISSLVISYTLLDTGIETDVIQWLRAGADVIKSMYAMLPYVVLGMFFALLTSSASSGIVISMVFFLCETILRGVLGAYVGPDATRILISVNIPLWMASLDFPTLDDPSAIYSYMRNFLSTFLPILAYIVVFGCASLWLFHRRDLRPSTGG